MGLIHIFIYFLAAAAGSSGAIRTCGGCAGGGF